MKSLKQANPKRTHMKVLLVLNKSQSSNFRILVKLQEKWLQEKVDALLMEKKTREAFNLIVSKAEVDSYLPPGAKLAERPQLTFIEDML